jgi:hypothetical protein
MFCLSFVRRYQPFGTVISRDGQTELKTKTREKKSFVMATLKVHFPVEPPFSVFIFLKVTLVGMNLRAAIDFSRSVISLSAAG